MYFQPLPNAALCNPTLECSAIPSSFYPMPAGWIDSTVEGRMVRLTLGDRLARLQRSWLLPFLIGASGGIFVWLPDALASL